MPSPLDRDITWLNARLDEVESSASRLDVERIHSAAQAMRASSEPDSSLATLGEEHIHAVLKVLTTRFHLRNKAEQVQIARINRRREREATPDAARPESLREAVGALQRDGVPLSDLRESLAAISIAPTLTAHPTESRRRSVVEKQRRIGNLIAVRNAADATPVEHARAESAVRRTLAILLATDEVRSRRLDVIDEVRNGIQYMSGAIWDAVPGLYRDLSEAIELYYGEAVELPIVLKYRSWIGGDRDGNPMVTAELTQRALTEMRDAAIQRHAQVLEQLRRDLSLSGRRVAIAPDLLESIERDEQQSPLDPHLVRHLRHEPFRVKIRHMQARLGEPAYTAGHFIDDLEVLQHAVIHADLHEVATHGLLADALVGARTFGFHLAALDIRQHSRVHEVAVAEMLRLAQVCPGYVELDEPKRLAVLRKELQTARPLLARSADVSRATRELLDTLAVVADASRNERESIGAYIVSMTHGVSDLLEVLILLREAGLWKIDDGAVVCPIDVVPLFETVDDLKHAAEVLGALFAESAYAGQLAARGRFQEIMLGYSDSNKDGGYWAANWGLFRAQDEMARVCASADVTFRFFHGRGGSIARGGGRAHRAILASPASSNTGQIRFTEQGEVISFRYAMPALAHRHLEQIVNAMIRRTTAPAHNQPTAMPAAALMDRLAETSRTVFRRLIDDPDFWPWFVQYSPVLHIGELPIASRPVSRSSGEISFESLRAIPWVFAWSQMRYNAPGWFGIGSAFEQHVMSDDRHIDECRAAYRANGAFRAFIDNAQQEMARARLPIAHWYASGEGERFHQRIAEEFALAERAILTVTGQSALLDNNKVIQQSIRERNGDTDAINALQVELLRRWRNASESDRPAIRSLIFLSVNALAAAMQSTG